MYGVLILCCGARGELSLATMRGVCTELGFVSPGDAAAVLIRLRVMGRGQLPDATGNGRKTNGTVGWARTTDLRIHKIWLGF